MKSEKMLMSTTPTIPGYKILEYKGVVWGITVRCKDFLVDYIAGWQQLFGGEMKDYVKMAEESHQEALNRMIASAKQRGANAIVEICIDSEMSGNTAQKKEKNAASAVTAYGTAVVVQPLSENE